MLERRICLKSYGYYRLEEARYDQLRFVSGQPIIPLLLGKLKYKENYEKYWNGASGDKVRQIVKSLAIFDLMNNDISEIKACIEAFNSSSYCGKYSYLSKLDAEIILENAATFLCSYPKFLEKLDKLCPGVQEVCLPGATLHSLLWGLPVPDWRNMYCNKEEVLSYKRYYQQLLAFYHGDKALLAKLDNNEDTLVQALTSTLEGDWKNADKLFARFLNDNSAAETKQWFQIICLLSFIIAVKTKSSQTRIKKLLKQFRHLFYHLSNDLFNSIFDFFINAEQYNNHNPFNLDFPKTPFFAMLGMLAFAQQKKTGDLLPNFVRETYDLGKKLLENDLNVLGIYLLNALGATLEDNDERRAAIQEATERIGIVPWFPMRKLMPCWEKALEELQMAYSQDEPAIKTVQKTGRIVWRITPREHRLANGQKIQTFYDIKPIFQKLKADGSYTGGRETNLAKLLSGSLNEALNTEEKEVFSYIKAIKDYWEISYSISPQILNCLTNSLVEFWDRAGYYKLVKEENSIVSRCNSKGDFEIRLKYFIPDLKIDTAVFDFTGDNVCHYCILSPKDNAYRTLDTYGKDGVLTVPASAASKLSDAMAQVSSRLKVTGALAGEAYRNLPAETAKIDLHLLLERSGASFLLHFRNKPLPNAELLMRPGIGEEMHVVNVDEKPVLLKRDLAKERKTIAEMFGKCPSLPDTVAKQHACEVDDLEQFLQILDEAREAGFILDWRNGSPIKVSRRLDHKVLRLSCEAKPGWLEVGGDISIDEGKVLSLKTLLDKYNGELGNFVRLDDNSYLKLTKDICRQIEALKAAGTMEGEKLKVANAAMPMLSTVFQDNLPKKMQEQIDIIKKAFEKEIKIPGTLQGTLRPYQEDGFRYLARLADCKIGCCLADDMGLGKTIQLLALLLREAANGPALVVCPASLCRNWEAEAHRFAPSLKTGIMPQFNREAFLKEMGNNCLVLCSYGVLQSEEELFCSKNWHTIILDEAQAVKNYATKRSKSVKKLTADIRIASTGTPVENNLLELWSIFDFLNQGLLGSAQAFDAKFCDNGMPRPILKRLVSPLIMRRRKSEVLDDLPPKTEITLPITLSDDERAMYELLRRQALEDLANADEKSRIAILAHLTKLKRFCCHPALLENKLDKAIAASKMQRLMELVEDLRAAGNKALVFSQYVDFLHIIKDEFDRRKISYQYLDGSTPLPARAKAVNDFQEGQGDFFLISLKAGGTGLNLTAASYVILADPWWNPAVENQAADRVHRIGQTHPVTLYRLITSDTVEEKVLELHKRKQRTSEDILDATESTTITIEELMSLFK
ncbi:MAG: DEAD/DEAH box helicase [Victivallales bacterium]|nr:DEAD/DEAH box helicase [Victivallales bacterium]